MAVYKRAYRAYDGPLTSERWRFLAIPRFALQEVMESRLLAGYLVLCFVPFLLGLGAVYVTNSPAARLVLAVPDAFVSHLMRPAFFLWGLTIQGALAFVLTAWVAPQLVSPDLVNGALPLYLSRPLSRAGYVLGKAAALAALLSAVTWVPLLLLFGLQAGLAGGPWLWANLRVGVGIFAGAWLWIAVLTLLGLALSALIRLRLAASVTLFAIFFVGFPFGEIWRLALENPWGRLANLFYLVGVVWTHLFGVSAQFSLARELLDDRADLPAWVAGLTLLAVCAACLWLLNRRLRAREVVA